MCSNLVAIKVSDCHPISVICEYGVGAVPPQLVRLPHPIHADDQPEPAGAARFDARQRILEHGRRGGRQIKGVSAGQIGVRRGLAG